VAVVKTNTLLALPVKTILPVPNATVLAFELLLLKTPQVSVFAPSVIVPDVSVKVPVATQRVGLPLRLKLMSDLSIVADEDTAVAATVTVAAAPELASKNTASAEVGAEAPLAPPDVADQLVVDVLFHVPVPPTQYLFAIKILYAW
jgi:hypothetical protein